MWNTDVFTLHDLNNLEVSDSNNMLSTHLFTNTQSGHKLQLEAQKFPSFCRVREQICGYMNITLDLMNALWILFLKKCLSPCMKVLSEVWSVWDTQTHFVSVGRSWILPTPDKQVSLIYMFRYTESKHHMPCVIQIRYGAFRNTYFRLLKTCPNILLTLVLPGRK